MGVVLWNLLQQKGLFTMNYLLNQYSAECIFMANASFRALSVFRKYNPVL